ncbi:hypothetical protein HUJ04_006952 [Dendroctonus ponderosae]|nr:hypothetical protein HUJ04_006952 [Dendroctonus ponderosae]
MANLPRNRICPVNPFSKVGIDFGGPFFIKVSRLRKAQIIKCYIAVYMLVDLLLREFGSKNQSQAPPPITSQLPAESAAGVTAESTNYTGIPNNSYNKDQALIRDVTRWRQSSTSVMNQK